MSAQERKVRDRAQRERSIVAAARQLAESDGWEAVTTRRLAERIEYSQPVLYSHFAGKDAIVAAVALEGFAELAQALAQPAAADPRAAAADSRAVVANPKTVVADPSAVVADPKAVVTDPRAAVADSRAVADPKSSAANPKSSAANLRSSVADPRAAVATVARRYLKFAEANPALYDAMFNLHTDLPFGRADTPAPLRAAFAAIQDVLAPVAGGRDSAVLAELTWSALHGIATLSRDGRLPPEYATERIDALVDLVTGQ